MKITITKNEKEFDCTAAWRIIGQMLNEPERTEWGPWNYNTNKENLQRFFREGIERAKGTDDLITIGMRGDGDEAMSEDADTRRWPSTRS